ncbi:hypothetical protein GCM10025868_20360 [Angustibacter aerolatus]|uniref:Uncharacterized protein n=1 Tax=Angustibacter aerolatus TaxID=1162965 RepID=A0ABQ6JF01_9ACTN|nr:hypothetical protein [Angustibacter aerolatus]GMA86786.1 hypothetical protein GCM10025868_20360 [Angustibacter aerolatus]
MTARPAPPTPCRTCWSSLYHQHRGASVETTRAALVEGIAARGLPEQPEPWLDSTATDLAGGRRVLLSSLEASGDVPRDPSEPS